MTARRLRAPATDGGLLVDPPGDEALGLLAANAQTLSGWDYDVQGRSAHWLRAQTRREVLTLARAFLRRYGFDAAPERETDADADRPLVVTGHQPELFHPGVWGKNFATAGLAHAAGGLALNLIVDNDIPKGSDIRVPALRDGRWTGVPVPFDTWHGEIPYEDWKVVDESVFTTFADRARDVLDGAIAHPLLENFWPRAVRRGREVDAVGMRFSLARREIEADWGVANLELPLGQLCQTEGFLWFASHLIAQLPRYQEVHNGCLAEYRSAHRIRSRHHPVAALGREGDWLEAPFWAWRAGSRARRRPLLARQRGRTMELRIGGEDEILVELPLHADGEACCAVERLRDLPADSVRIRTRALTTTAFARFFLGDLFLHGIGGAKYDELGDAISARFFGIEPPGFLAISMTARLGLPVEPVTPADVLEIDRRLRDLTFNPDRDLPEPSSPELRKLIEEKRAALAGPISTRRDRVARAVALRRINAAMQPWVAEQRAEMLERRRSILAGLRSSRMAGSREFASVLHSEDRLRGAFRDVGGWKARS